MSYADIKGTSGGGATPPIGAKTKYSFQGDPGELRPFVRPGFGGIPNATTTTATPQPAAPTVAPPQPTPEPTRSFVRPSFAPQPTSTPMPFRTIPVGSPTTQATTVVRPMVTGRSAQEHVLEVPRDPHTFDRPWAYQQRRPTVGEILWDLFARVCEAAIGAIAQEISLFFFHRRLGGANPTYYTR